jgi:hypothetical protein
MQGSALTIPREVSWIALQSLVLAIWPVCACVYIHIYNFQRFLYFFKSICFFLIFLEWRFLSFFCRGVYCTLYWGLLANQICTEHWCKRFYACQVWNLQDTISLSHHTVCPCQNSGWFFTHSPSPATYLLHRRPISSRWHRVDHGTGTPPWGSRRWLISARSLRWCSTSPNTRADDARLEPKFKGSPCYRHSWTSIFIRYTS